MKSTIEPMNLKMVLPILLVYGVVSAVGLHYHELFLDEAHHFLVSRDSGTLGELYSNLRYDGHPRLWGALLFLITHYITVDPVAMQVLQWCFAMVTAFVLLRYGPFSWWMKVLILAGYYFLFEYDLLSRNYAIGIWMLFLCCHLLRDVERNAWGIGLLILFMCSAHLFFAFASVAIFLYAVMDWWGRGVEPRAGRRWNPVRFAVLAVPFAAGMVMALIQAQTPSVDNVNMTPVNPAEWLSGKNFSFAASALVQGWLPIPQVGGGRFWNSSWLNVHGGPVLPFLLFAVLLVFPAVYLRRRFAAIVFYYSGLGLLMVFFVATQMTANRYFGMVYVFFLAAAWLTADGAGEVLSTNSVPGGLWVRRSWWVGWITILVVQVVVGLYAYCADLRRPFSQSRNTADYLRSLGADGCPIVVDGYTAGPMLCAYLEEKLWNLSSGGESSYCIWRSAYFPSPRLSVAQEFARYPGLRELGEFILVSNRNLGEGGVIGGDAGVSGGDRGVAGYRLTALKSFENSIVGENYYVYRVDPVPVAGASPVVNPAF